MLLTRFCLLPARPTGAMGPQGQAGTTDAYCSLPETDLLSNCSYAAADWYPYSNTRSTGGQGPQGIAGIGITGSTGMIPAPCAEALPCCLY